MENMEVTENTWLHKATLYELLALGLRLPTKELAEVLSNGEFADALQELAELNELTFEDEAALYESLAAYQDKDADALFHELRIEYTHLFVGAPEPAVSPYAGVWWAREVGVEPLLFVNKESMAVERFMRSCGVGQPEGTNEPLDHIASELEFLQYLCMLRAGAALPEELPEDFALPEQAYEEFFEKHLANWIKKLAAAIAEKARMPFYRVMGYALNSLS